MNLHMIKNRILSVLFCILLILQNTIAVSANYGVNDITLVIGSPYMQVGNQLVEIDPGRDTAPIISNGRTLVPIRAVVESLGGTVEWLESTSSAVLVYKDVTIRLQPENTTAYVNGESSLLDTPPSIINGRTMIPVRFVAEKFGFDVRWVGENQQIIISLPSLESTFAVHYIDVGQGDGIFVQLPDGKTMLIDAGPEENVVNTYIKKLGVNKLDYVIATHPDADHIGGMPQVLDEFCVGEFFMPNKAHNTKLFENLLDSLDNKGCTVTEASAGVIIGEGKDYRISFVAPVKLYDSNNNSSAVIIMDIYEKRFLFTGDIEQQGEFDILELGSHIDADVLKIAHHGSAGSTTDVFLDRVSPQIAVISAGIDNSYGHPSPQVIEKLSKRGIISYTTANCGSVTIGVVDDSLVVQCSVQDLRDEGIADKISQQSIYRTKTGKKYHLGDCARLQSKIEISFAKVAELGLEPCSVCNPHIKEGR